MDVIYLDVPFRDKDVVKALGARWDGAARRWFVGRGNEERFTRWIKEAGPEGAPAGALAVGAPSTSAAPSPADGSARVGASLSSVLFEVTEAVSRALPRARWIIAEVASARTHSNSGHTYLELVEHDASGREIAKASGRIWSANSKILRRFERETGGKVAEGMKLLVLAQGDFSIQYGFGLTIEDIDPAWTLGEMQLKVRQIRERLAAEEIVGLNSGLSASMDFVSVAVIAPDGAAGLGDFMADANKLVAAGLCQFHFIPAVFEGAGALLSLVGALAVAREMAGRGEVDAVAIVRGGGAKTSLNWLNEYEIARQICLMPCPAMVGIGHERDETVLDEVACESFDTPSKVVGAIIGRVVGNARAAELSLEQLRREVGQACSVAKKNAVALMGEVEQSAKSSISVGRAKLDMGLEKVAQACMEDARAAKSDIEALAREVMGLGPRASLERGYCVAKQNGQAKSRVSQLDAEGGIVLVMADGEVALRRA